MTTTLATVITPNGHETQYTFPSGVHFKDGALVVFHNTEMTDFVIYAPGSWLKVEVHTDKE